MKRIKFIAFLAVSAVFFAVQAQAALLELTLVQEQNGVNRIESRSFDSILELTKFDQNELNQIISGYDIYKPATLHVNYRGVYIRVENKINKYINGSLVATQGVATQNTLPAFTGYASQVVAYLGNEILFDALSDQFKDNPTEIINKINAVAVEQTPFDPIAGNPSSFLYRMQDSAYNAAAYNYSFRPSLSVHNLQKTTYLGVKTSTQDVSIMSVNVPLGFNLNFGENTGLTVDIPITATFYDGSLAGDISAGATWRQTLFSSDTLQFIGAAGLRVGIGGSLDLGTAGVIWGLNGTLVTNFFLSDAISFKMVNNVGYYNAPPYDLSSLFEGIDMSIPYNFDAFGLKNSIAVNYHFTEYVFAQLAFIDTRFLKFDQYISYYDEVRFAVAYDRGEGGFIEDVEAYVGYKFGENDYTGFELGVGLKF